MAQKIFAAPQNSRDPCGPGSFARGAKRGVVPRCRVGGALVMGFAWMGFARMGFAVALQVHFFEALALFGTEGLLDFQVLIHLQYFHLCPQGGDLFYLVVDFFAVRFFLVHEGLQI